jgi:hypothetical protein
MVLHFQNVTITMVTSKFLGHSSRQGRKHCFSRCKCKLIVTILFLMSSWNANINEDDIFLINLKMKIFNYPLTFQLDIRNSIVTISLHLHLEKQCFVYLEIIFFNSIIIYGQRILLNLVLGAVWNFLWGMCM